MSKPIPTLQELVSLFGRTAANEELDKPVRAFAAQMTLLTAHVRRIDSDLKEKDEQIAELASLILVLQQQKTRGAPAPEASNGEGNGNGAHEEASEEDEAIAMAERVRSETEAELRKLEAQPPKPAAPPVALVKQDAKPIDGAAS